MLYILDHKFTAGVFQSTPMRGGSVTEQIALNRRHTKVPVDSGFEPGKVYKLTYISPLRVDGELKVKYLFQALNTGQTIEKIFNDCSAGDDFIARISGETDKLIATRNQIAASLAEG